MLFNFVLPIVGRAAPTGRFRIALALVRAHVPFFHISCYSITITLVSAFSSSFTLAVSKREVSCVGSPLPAGYTRLSLVFRGEVVLMAEALLPINRLGRSPI